MTDRAKWYNLIWWAPNLQGISTSQTELRAKPADLFAISFRHG